MSYRSGLVYVVDDDASVREGLASLVRSAGLTAKAARSGQEFLAMPRPDVPSCLVLDVQMPGISGIELQQELVRSGNQIPIIFMTGHGDIPMTVRALKAGAMEFFPKPVDDEELLNAITRCISGQHAHQDLREVGTEILRDIAGKGPVAALNVPKQSRNRSPRPRLRFAGDYLEAHTRRWSAKQGSSEHHGMCSLRSKRSWLAAAFRWAVPSGSRHLGKFSHKNR